MPDHVSVCSRKDSGQFLEWLTTELAPTIRGSKPATILTFMNSTYQATLTIWRQYGSKVLRNSTVQFMPLRCSPKLETVLFYRADAMNQCIIDKHHSDFLSGLGYPVEEGVEACIALLCQRFRHSCPHEIGILLGIPLKDVLGFMEKTNLPLTCRREWCIYGNPDVSLAAMGRFADDKNYVSCLIADGVSPYDIMCSRPENLDNIA